MKRIPDLQGDECDIVFGRLDLVEKKRALFYIFGNDNDDPEVQVYRDDARVFRDVLGLITRHVSLQTWARLRQCCRAFRHALVLQKYEPARLVQQYVIMRCEDPTHGVGLKRAVNLSILLETLFFPFVRRLIRHLSNLHMEARQRAYADYQKLLAGHGITADDIKPTAFADWKVQFDNVTMNTLFGAKYSISCLETNKFDEQVALLELGAFCGNVMNDRKRKWFVIPRVMRIHYPEGFICPLDSTRSPGNIYCEGDVESICVVSQYGTLGTKHYKDMTKEEKAHYQHCKSRMEALPKF